MEIVFFHCQCPVQYSFQFSDSRGFPSKEFVRGFQRWPIPTLPWGPSALPTPQHGQRRGKKERTENENEKNKNNFIIKIKRILLRLNSNGFSFSPTRIAQGVHITKEVKLDGYVNSNGMLINAFLVLSQGLPYN